ncbi:MAG: hypothetical protein JNL58_00655 [Planctomyces sp.]|nr:hypothetical protein [Planctomyces sp.]
MNLKFEFAMLIAQWTISLLLIALSTYISLGQWWAMYWIPKKRNALGQPRNYSMIPLVGGVLGAIGCWLAPAPSVRSLWWLPLIFDPGCVLLFGSLVVFLTIEGIERMRMSGRK